MNNGIFVAAAYGTSWGQSLGKRPEEYNFAGGASGLTNGQISSDGRYIAEIDGYGRKIIRHNVAGGAYVWVENGRPSLGLMEGVGASGAAVALGPTLLSEGLDGVWVNVNGVQVYQPLGWRNRNGIHGADYIKDVLGADFGSAGLRYRHNSENGVFYIEGSSTVMSVSQYLNLFAGANGTKIYGVPTTIRQPNGDMLVGNTIVNVEGDKKTVYFQRATVKENGDIEYDSYGRVEKEPDGSIKIVAISEEEGTAILNIAQSDAAGFGSYIDAMVNYADNGENGGLESLVGEIDVSALEIPNLEIEFGDEEIVVGLQTVSDAPVFETDPETGAILPTNTMLRTLPDGSVGKADRYGRSVELVFVTNEDGVPLNAAGEPLLDAEGNLRTDITDTAPVVRETRVSDGQGRNGKGGVKVVQQIDPDTHKPVSTDILIAGNPVPFDFSDIGAALGQQLGYRIAGNNVVLSIGSSAILQTLGDNIGDVLDGLIGNQSATQATKDAFSTFGPELLANLKSAGVGALSSFLTAELINAVGLDGLAGELANTTAGAVIGQVLTNIVDGAALFEGVNLAMIGNAVGSFLGTKLAQEIIGFETIGGQIGSAVGSAVASAGLALLFAEKFTMLGGFAGPLGAFAGAFLGFIVGGLIGSIFGGTPRSGADVVWDGVNGEFKVANSYSRKGGSKSAAEALASSVAETFNFVLTASGGQLSNPQNIQTGNYGMRKSSYVYRPMSSRDKDAITYKISSKSEGAFDRISAYGIFKGITDPDFQIVGGSNYVKRAIYASFETAGVTAENFEQSTLIGNISSARAYENYLLNKMVIGALASAESDSAFSLETTINLVRASELGLTRRHRSDWFGGFNAILDEAGAVSSEVTFSFAYDPFSDKISRRIGFGQVALDDAIDVAGQTVIEAGGGAEAIDLRTGKLENQIGYTVNDHLNDDIAITGTDFTALANSVTFAANALRATATVALANDGITEAVERFEASLSNAAAMQIMGDAAVATVIDGTAALPTLLVGDSYAWEGDGYAVFRLSLSKAASQEITFALALADGNAKGAGADYGAAGAANIQVSLDGVTWSNATAATFAVGVKELFVRTAVVSDNAHSDVEGNERFTLSATVTAGANALANGTQTVSGTGTIVDGAGGEPLVWIDDVIVDEATGQARFVISRSRTMATSTTVGFATSDRRLLDIDIAATVDAGAGDDTVYASNLGDNIIGGAGNDKLYGGRLDDWLLGGDGDDLINAGSDGAGTLGGDGNYLDGGAGNDLLIGREGSDWLEGGDGTDTLEGGDGGDVLAGGAGVGDQLRGGRGDDQYIFRIGDVGATGIGNATVFDEIRDESGMSLTSIVQQAYGGSVANNAAALNGSLFRDGRGLDNWRGGGAQVTPQGVAAGGNDALVLGVGIGIEDIKILKSADNKDLIVELWPDGVFAGDRVIMRDWFTGFNQIETLRFADGNEIRLADFDTYILGSDSSETIVGTAGNDFVHAGAGNDLVYLLSGNDFGNGGLGDDTVSGDSGNDIVAGADGDDTLYGGAGRDTVSGGRGNDRLSGDDGNDILAGGAGNDEAIGGSGDDLFKFQRGDGRDILIDALSNEWDVVWVSGQGGQNGYVVNPDGTITHATYGTLFDGTNWAARTRYDIETGTLYLHRPANADAVVANSGADLLEFGIGIDINDIQFQVAANGKDLIVGIEGSGSVTASFASIADQIILKEWVSNPGAKGSIEKFAFFNTGAVNMVTTDIVAGTDGNDTLTGNAARENWVTGGAGDDTLSGAGLNDIINGNSGDDRLLGLAGADVLLGGAGNDVLIGGAGGTRDGAATGDLLFGGDGLDTASYETASAAVKASLATPAPISDATAGDAAGDVYDGIENLRGSDFADTLEGDLGENELTGGKGDDLLKGGSGDDIYVFGRGDGNDTILDVAAAGEIVLMENGKLAEGYVSTVQLVDREGNSNIYEHVISEVATGEVVYRKEIANPVAQGLNFQAPGVFARDGFVRNLDGSEQFDFVNLDSGGNTIAASRITIPRAAPGGTDTILLQDYTGDAGFTTGSHVIALSDLSFAFTGNDLDITLNTASGVLGGKITIQNFRSGAAANANSAVETIQFSDGSSVNLAGLKFDANGVLLAASTDTLAAPADDLIVSNAATLSGGFGNDTLVGGAGANTLQGGDGDDMLVGGLGADVLQGGAGVDTVSYLGSDGSTGVTVNLTTNAGSGAGSEAAGDTYNSIENVIGSQLADTLTGNDADNVLKGNGGDDVLSGGSGTGLVKGLGADVLIGDDGNDTLTGGVQDDNLDGGAGNDVLEGGADRDILAGGDGNDILRGDTYFVAAGNDASADEQSAYGIVNASFEVALDGSAGAGWASSETRPVAFVTGGVTGLTGTRAVHLDDGTGNITLTQEIKGLRAGEGLSLAYTYAGMIAGETSGFEILWNGEVIVRSVNGTGPAMTNGALGAIPAAKVLEGTNTLSFRAIGTVDSNGVVIDNVRLTRTGGGNDQLVGGAGSDRLIGGGGDDVLLGGDGDDASTINITAGAGAGQTFAAGLYGGAGNDTLDGGAGNDTLDGGAGNDRYLFAAGSGNDSVVTGGGQDELVFDKIAHNQLWLRQVGNDLEITAIGLGSSVLVKNWFAGTANQARRLVAADKSLARGDVQALVAAMAAVSATVPSTWPAAPAQALTDALTDTWQDNGVYVDSIVYTGTSGADTLVADPTLAGGAKFYGLAGNDVLTGGAGNDEFHFGVDSGFKTIDGKAGNDVIIADVDNATIGLTSTAAAPLASIEKISGNGKSNVVVNLNTAATIDLTAVVVEGIAQINGSSGIDTIIGSAANDFILGAGGNDVLKGGLGNDRLRGGAGSDNVDGGDGIDTYDASDITAGGTISLVAGTHVQGSVIDTLANIEDVIGGTQADTIIGSAGANRLDGGGAADNIDGGDGDDILVGGAGGDKLVGGVGSDTASYDTMAVAATATTDATSGLSINGVKVDLKINSSTNGTTAPGVKAAQGDAAGDWFYQVENLTGSQFGDMLTGDDSANLLSGGAGADALYGGAGDDRLSGDAGNDYIDGQTGSNTAVYAGNFADYLIVAGVPSTTVTGVGARAADGTDTLKNIQFIQFADHLVSLGIDANNKPVLGVPGMADQSIEDGAAYSYQIPVTAFIDLDLGDAMSFTATLADGSTLPTWLSFNPATRTFSGTPPVAAVGTTIQVKVTATDQGYSISDGFELDITLAKGADINGTAAANTLAGTFRGETMVGLAGNDVFTGSGGADRIDGGADIDRVDYSASTAGIVIDLATGSAAGGDAEGDTLISIEEARGSAFDDRITGTAGGDKLYGGGVESQIGSPDTVSGADRIDGGGGDDLIAGGDGADILLGGSGNDLIYGRAKADGTLEDTVDGGSGTDELRLGGDGAAIRGSAFGAVLDLSAAGSGAVSIEHVVGSAYDDTITGNDFANNLSGGLGNDMLSGGDGNDSLSGNDGDDALIGGRGADILRGDIGNDRLQGGAGGDQLYGGAGIDTVDYRTSEAGVTVNLTTGTASGGDAQGDQFADGLIENIDGSDFADTLTGSSAANVLKGFGGDDVLQGGAGNDSFDGGAGSDKLVYTGNRADYVINFAARTITDTNLANGDDGTDSYTGLEFAQFADQTISLTNQVPVTGTPGPVSQNPVDNAAFSYAVPATAFSDPDGDTLTYSATLSNGSALPAWLVFTAATRTFSFASGAATAFIGQTFTVRVTASDGQASASSNFDITIAQGIGATITGTTGVDTINGTFRVETINALAGNDIVNGSAGADTIDGGDGVDIMSYASSAAGVTISLAGGAGTGGDAAGDTLTNVEDLNGSAFADQLTGNTLANVIDAGAGNDTILGGSGDDTLVGGAGNDTLRGEDGNDNLFGGSGADIIDGGAGSDYANYSSSSLRTGNDPVTTGVTADLQNSALNTGFAAGDTYISIEHLYGTAFADTLGGDDAANFLQGRDGNDTLLGRGGGDNLYGGLGNDTLDGGLGNDYLTGDEGNDILTGGAGTDIVNGGDGDDLIHALVVGEDTIDGGAGTDTASFAAATANLFINLANAAHKLTNIENVVGGSGADSITGAAGANRLEGGLGNDIIEGGAGADVLMGGDGIDTLLYSGSAVGTNFNSGSIGQSTVNGVVIVAAVDRVLNGVNVNLLANSATGADATGDVISGFENLTGSAFGDLLRGNSGNSIVNGLTGDDVIYGGAGDDKLYGDMGNDIIYGEAGVDQIYGGDGDDRLFGDGASDFLYGDAGNDLLDAGDAGDYLDGGAGNDIMIGGQGQDHYVIGRNSGADTIYNYDDDSALDSVSYETADNIAYSELWFTKVGKDLVVKILGTTTATTIKDWFANATAGDWTAADNFYVDVFIAGSRVNRQVNLPGLLTTMQGITQPANFAALTATQRAQIDNSWGLNQIPTITAVAGNPTTVNEDGSINLRFTVADAETSGAGISVVVTTDGVLQTVVPASDVRVIDATTREVTIRPNANAFGSGNVRIRAYDGALYSAELVVPISVAAVADGVTLSGPASASGNTGTSISLAGILAGLIDTDGSEVLDMLRIEGLPAGAQLVSGANSATTATVDIRSWNLSTLALNPGASATDYVLTVRARSRETSNNALSAEITKTITVTVNGAPTAVNVTPAAFNENVAGALVATLGATDPDSGGSFTYAIVGGADAAKFVISGTSLSLAAGQSLNFESGPATIDIRVTDQGGLSYTRTGVQISATNVNEALGALTDNNGAANTLADGSGAGTLVGVTALAVDPDGTAPVYSITGGNSLGWFTINASTGVVSVVSGAVVQYETTSSVTLTIQASDGVTTPVSANFTINISDVNEAPTITSANSGTLAENAAAGTLIRTLTSSDPDLAGNSFGNPANRTYTIIAGNSAGKFAISGGNLVVAAGATFDYDNPATRTFNLTLQVTDGGGLTATQAFTVNLSNINETPFGLADVNAAANLLTEGQGAGSATGATMAATDPDGDALTYSITSDQYGWFQINPTTGVVTIRAGAVVNYETTTNGTATVNVQATDAGGLSVGMTNLTFTVTDTNEAPTFTSAASASVSEAVSAAAYIATISTTDLDKDGLAFGEAGHVLYIYSGDTSLFELRATANPNVKELWKKDGVILDYDVVANRTHGLQFRVYDNSGNSGWLDAYQNFTVNVAAVNEKPTAPTTAIWPSAYENDAASAAITGSVDPDGSAVTYAFASGGNTGGLFAITNPSGAAALTFVGGVTRDFEWVKANAGSLGAYVAPNDTYAYIPVTIVATDGVMTSDPFTTYFHIYNRNDNAPGAPVVSAWGTTAFNENSGAGYVVATLTAGDADGVLNPLSYELTNNPDGMFEIVGNQVRVITSRHFDYERLASGGASTSLSVGVRTVDGTYGSGTTWIAVQINNTNDNAPVLTAPTVLTISENLAIGTIVTTVNATDADGTAPSYSIVAGNINNAFSINSSGQIVIANGGVDYESANWLSDANGKYAILSVAASDGANTSATRDIRINITNIRKYVYNNGNIDMNLYEMRFQNTQLGDGPLGYDEPVRYPQWGQQSWFNESWLVEKSTGNILLYLGEYSQWEGTTSRPFPHGGTPAEGYTANQHWNPGNAWPAPPYTLYADDENINTSHWGVPMGNPYMPVVIDLLGDGFELSSAFESGLVVNLFGDARRQVMGWVKASDGILALDRNGDGMVQDLDEISFVKDREGATTDLEGLVTFDTNGNSLLDEGDDAFATFRIWRDINQDGIGQSHELVTLAEMGIRSISLVRNVLATSFSGVANVISATSVVTWRDGSTGQAGDVGLGWVPLPDASNTASPEAQAERREELARAAAAAVASTEATPAAEAAALTPQPLPKGTSLALDRDGDGAITVPSEVLTLAGAMAEFDSNGDALITAQDARYFDLRLWADANRNGRVEATELKGLDQAGLTALSLDAIDPAVAPLAYSGKAKHYRMAAANGTIRIVPREVKGPLSPDAGQIGEASYISFDGRRVGMLSAILVDLDGDGLESRRAGKTKAAFDINDDGQNDDTGWMSGGDGMLVIDRDGDGAITKATELSFLSEKEGAKNSWEGLATLDSNRDGKLDKADTRFAELKVWVDRNGDGVSQADEINSLGGLGITEISLRNLATSDSVKVGNNLALSTATYARANGTTATIGEVAFGYTPSQRAAQSPAAPGDGPGTTPVDAARAASNLAQAMSRFGTDAAEGDLRNFPKDGMGSHDWFAAAVA
jgi:Ca2+-binding RTX toxin-like protein